LSRIVISGIAYQVREEEAEMDNGSIIELLKVTKRYGGEASRSWGRACGREADGNPSGAQAKRPPEDSPRRAMRSAADPGGSFVALNGVDLRVKAGEFVTVVGKSGSGKSTLLNIIAGIDRPSSGEVVVAGTPVHRMSESRIAAWRGKSVGVVFQFFQLLPTLTVVENVMLPMDFCHTYPVPERRSRAMALLESVGIAAHAAKMPSALSGGEQQRVAFCRALANDPPILLADEPTGNLDSQSAAHMLDLFTDLVKRGKTVVMVTHERMSFPEHTRRIILRDGQIDSDGPHQGREE
jgi:putative ABC transport system ATP-binding protein